MSHFQFSQQAKSKLPDFFHSLPNCDVLIIVEDSWQGCDLFYQTVLKRVLADADISFEVQSAGGKRAVLSRLNRSIPREFYLIDGDFDELLSSSLLSSPFLYRLDRYDIESFLMEEDAICEIAVEQEPSRSIDDYVKCFGVNKWIAEVVESSSRLLACEALLADLKLKSDFKSVERFNLSEKCVPCQHSIQQYVEGIKNSQTAISMENFERRLGDFIDRMDEADGGRSRWVSGKKILIPLLLHLYRLHGCKNLYPKSLYYRLAKLCKFRDLISLRQRMLALGFASGHRMSDPV
ncbi:MAG: DUF4435 domain-containing protein [Caldilineaceae bacterium SB0662_bin_9]|uniref:DUF4435 domain-containing protein n=1 Tax=Caldilineaceae bacterium SB0662_bin_9 TaxID=2605258 RepID=A0A6B1DYS1_9CHLR|nr:DUF4435 domain-containing protein [Caldilineaceae bacterium SB0662_bin_9]